MDDLEKTLAELCNALQPTATFLDESRDGTHTDESFEDAEIGFRRALDIIAKVKCEETAKKAQNV
jgi:hypothetical protein